MTSPIPFNDNAKDDAFDRGLEKVLAGDLSGLDDIDPDLHDTVLEMAGLANTAGWIGTEPGPPLKDTRPIWIRWERALSKVAAVLLVLLLGATGFLGWRVYEQQGETPDPRPATGIEATTASGDFPYVSTPQAALGSGTCSREPLSDAEIARIVQEPDGSWEAPPVGDARSNSEINANLVQITRDWTSCLATGQFDHAMAYESENFIRAMMKEVSAEDLDDLSDEEISEIAIGQHRLLEPMAHGENIEIVIYVVNWSTVSGGPVIAEGRIDTEDIQIGRAEIWMVPVYPDGEWVEWPTVITFVYEDGRWMIQLTDREGSPATPVPEPPDR